MYVPFLASHTPLQAPEDLLQKYKHLKDTRKPTRNTEADKTRSNSQILGSFC